MGSRGTTEPCLCLVLPQGGPTAPRRFPQLAGPPSVTRQAGRCAEGPRHTEVPGVKVTPLLSGRLGFECGHGSLARGSVP